MLVSQYPLFLLYQKSCFPFGNRLCLAYYSLVSICYQSHGLTSLPRGTTWSRLANHSPFLGIDNETGREKESFSFWDSPAIKDHVCLELLEPSLAPCGQSQSENKAAADVFAKMTTKMSPIPHDLLWHASYERVGSMFPPRQSGKRQKWHWN